MKKYININFNEFLREHVETFYTIDSFPENIKSTLDEYSMHFEPEYDWNTKQDEFNDDRKGFSKWLKDNKDNGLRDNIDTLIEKLDEDIKLIDAQDKAKIKLDSFEELIIPALGNEVLTPALNKYQEEVLMNPYASKEDLERGFKEGQSIFNEHGDIDKSKTEMSKIFVGDSISLPNFERFVENNPEYQGVFDDWKKIFDEYIDLSLKDLNAFRSSTSKERIQELKDFLLQYKRKNNL
jgi:hypothetical protein